MSKDVFDKAALIQLRLDNAKETLNDAQVLYKHGSSPKSIVNRAYYAMFYATLALLVTVSRHSSKHSGVISIFDREFVNKSLVPKELGKMLHEAFDSRQQGDYQDISKIDLEKASEILKSAEEFVRLIEEKLSSKS